MELTKQNNSVAAQDNVEWRDVPGYEGCYRVNEQGEIMSVTRYVRHMKGGFQILRGRILRQTITKSGYVTVALSKNGKLKTHTVHKVVMMAFNGKQNLVVDHINGDKSDNRLMNLRYCTQRENIHAGRKRFPNKTLPLGVSMNEPTYKKRYCATISINGKSIHLGSFMTPDEASHAYQNKLQSLNN